MLKNIINRFETYQALNVNKNFNSQELTVLGKILLEGSREVEVANVIRFPSIERGFSIFSIETGAALSASPKVANSTEEGQTATVAATHAESALPRLATGLVNELKNDAYHLIVRQGNALENGMVLASFSNVQSAGMALRKLAKLNARKSRFWKILGFLIVVYLLLSLPMIKRTPGKSMEEITSSMELRNPEIARQVENANRARTVGSEIMNQPLPAAPMQPDPASMLGGATVPQTESQPAAPVTKPAQANGNFGF